MPKKNSTVKAVRVDNEKLAELERRIGDQTINSWMNERIDEFLNGKKGVNPSDSVAEIESMANFFSLSLDEFMDGVLEGLNDGSLTVNGKKVEGKPTIKLERFFDVCHERGLDPQSVLDKTTTNIEKGK